MGDIEKKQIRYPGYHELAYLHPKWFKPDRDVLGETGIGDKNFFILRFVSWQASHDIKQKGVSHKMKMELIETLTKYGQVFITSEAQLPSELESYRLPLGPEKLHHLMAFATMVIGEGATVASEAAMLGVPAFYITKPGGGLGYTNELEEKYGLIFNFDVQQCDSALQKIKDLLKKPDLKEKWLVKRDKMLNEKIDVTEFIARFIETYPVDKERARELPQLMKKKI
jgi:predicted glycosyltransferase